MAPRPTRQRVSDTKLYVLDTNVLMHDPTSLFRFEEHDIYLPIITLEELDNHKTGMNEISRNGRQVSRTLDSIVSHANFDMAHGIPLAEASNGQATGHLFVQHEVCTPATMPPALSLGQNDNHIIAVCLHLRDVFGDRKIILVSKDINMRVKARALGIEAQDYFNDKVLEDTDLLYSGMRELPPDFWETHGDNIESWKQDHHTCYRIHGPVCREMMVNEFVRYSGDMPLSAIVRDVRDGQAVLQTLTDHVSHKHPVWGITARNPEQNFALNLLLDPEIDFVTLLGQAGTGKTLLTLAAGLTQVLEDKRYSEIIMTRVTVPVGEDIGFLPGDEEEKMNPWMGALYDNLDVLTGGENHDPKNGPEWNRAATNALVRERIKVKSLNFMRGRTFQHKFLIIDEAQNLTPKQMKTLITRAGPGTKVVCLGNLGQIDTPYLTEGGSGLTYVVERFKGWQHNGHITLQRGERSRLADHASEVL